MTADHWTWEEHPASWDEGVTAWHAVAPTNTPGARLPPWYRFGVTLPDGRTAYPFTGPYAARDAAERANQRKDSQ